MADLLNLNPQLDEGALAGEFARTGRLQIRDVLTGESAARVQDVLVNRTPWNLAWQSGPKSPPQVVKARQVASMAAAELERLASRAAADPDYGFAYHSYPLVTAYLERWSPGSPQERLLEELNSPELLQFMRDVTGFNDIVKMDGQATLYTAGNFLRPHNDEESERGRQVAYVLNMTVGSWDPTWGGLLRFFDKDWDVEQEFIPSFNCLNLFRVPQWHEVSQVAPDAPKARYAITGWARNR